MTVDKLIQVLQNVSKRGYGSLPTRAVIRADQQNVISNPIFGVSVFIDDDIGDFFALVVDETANSDLKVFAEAAQRIFDPLETVQ